MYARHEDTTGVPALEAFRNPPTLTKLGNSNPVDPPIVSFAYVAEGRLGKANVSKLSGAQPVGIQAKVKVNNQIAVTPL